MSKLFDIEGIVKQEVGRYYFDTDGNENDEITNQKIDAYKKQADAVFAYLDFQNKQVGIISDYIERGGVISPKLSQMVDEFQKNGLIAFKNYIETQKRKIKELSNIQ